MSFVAYAFVLVFLSSLAELLLASFGVGLPLLGMVCFYLSVSAGFWRSVPFAVVGGCAIDSVLGRAFPGSAILLLLVLALGQLWVRRSETRALFLLPLPGALLPPLMLAPWALPRWELSPVWFTAFFDCLSATFLAMLVSAFLMPCAVLAFDYFGARLELELFVDAKERLARET
jgi:hypothetical protein